MDMFVNAKSVRLISYRDKYLVAEEGQETVYQDEGHKKSTVWTVELVQGKNYVRLKSCFGTYLTASSMPLLPGVTAKRVVQTPPTPYSDPATEWEPIRDGMQVKLRSFWGNFLRPNGGLPPWRNIVTHDISHLPNSRNKLLWDVEVVEKRQAKPKLTHDNKFHRCRSRSYSSSMTSHLQTFRKSQDYI